MDIPAPVPSPQPGAKKRKRATVAAPSPAPSDTPLGSNGNGSTGAATPELLSSRSDLSSRPRLTISRGPIFTPINEGSIFCKTDLVGINRVGYRYSPAGIGPPGFAQPCRTIETSPTSYRISWEDRSPFVHVTRDGLELLGTTGFRSARCNAPVREGRWYMEVKIIRGGGEHAIDDTRREGSHVRLGWGRREAPLNGPVGLDGYSYGYRDKTGEKVTLSRPRPYGKPFSSGDVIGMYISLPSCREPSKKDPYDPAHLKRERITIDFKGQELFESLEYPPSKEMTSLMDYSGKAANSTPLPSTLSKKPAAGKHPTRAKADNPKPNPTNLRPLSVLRDSYIAFFLNGECEGAAFQDIYDYLQLRNPDAARKGKEKRRGKEGVKEHRENPFDDGTLGYYPFISLFNDASVRLNPGPDFEFPPPPDIDNVIAGNDVKNLGRERTWRPICERYAEFMDEQWKLDAIEEEEAQKDAARLLAAETVEAEKRAQRHKKRRLNDIKSRHTNSPDPLNLDEYDRLPNQYNGTPTNQSSPLRNTAANAIESMMGSDDILEQTALSLGAEDNEGGASEPGDFEEKDVEDGDEKAFEERANFMQSINEPSIFVQTTPPPSESDIDI